MNNTSIYKDTNLDWIPSIPENWDVIRSKFIFENKSVKNCPDEPLLSVTQKNGLVLRSDLETKVWNPTDDTSGYKLIESGDFVISLRSFEGGLELSRIRGLVSPAYTVLRSTKTINVDYYRWLMKSHEFIVELNKNVTGIRQGKNIGWDDFSNIYLCSPPLEEQQLISRYLDKKTEQINSLIEKVQMKIKLLKEQRTSLINRCVTKGLDSNVEMKDSGVEWIDETPKHWRQQSIKYVLNDYFGGSWGEDLVEDQTKGVVQVVRITEFDWNTLSVSENIPTLRSLELKEDSKKLIRRGDLVIEKSGGGEKTPVGRVVLIDRELTRPTVNSNFTNIFRPDQEKLDPRFGVYLFYTLYVGGMTVRNIKQTTGIQNLDIEGFLSEKIFLPPKEEQEQIQIFLDNSIKKILHLVRKHTDQLKLLTEYRQSLISSVVTGKVRVTEDMI